MIRKLPLVVAIAATFAPVGAFALGLGEIHPRSALNQGFNADIDLLSVKQGELDDVKVSLAAPEAFTRAGVERPFLLTKLRFKPERKPNGTAVIHVSSRVPIKEPFVNFLVEVNWPKGRLVREYTVLLDPPVTFDRAPAPVQAPKVARGAATSPSSVTTRSVRGEVSRAGSVGALAPTGSIREYGPTERNDTLWEIADYVKSDGASVEQTMMALWRKNPHAFYGNNVNNLKVGQILRVPADEAIRSLGRAEARQEFLAQTSQWREQRRSSATSIARQADQLPKPDSAKSPTPDAADSESELKLASAVSETETKSTGSEGVVEESVRNLESNLLLAREASERARQEGEDLRSRIDELEGQLQDVQRLLELKNSQLARMQRAAGDQSQLMEKVDELPQIEAQPAPDSETEVGSAITAESSDEIVVAEDESDVAEVAETGDQDESVPADVLGEETIAGLAEPAPATEIDISSEAAASESSVDGSESLFDKLKSNAVYLGMAGAAAALLLGLMGLLVRRRRAEEAEFQESILVADGDSVTHELIDAQAPQSQHTDDISFLSDFSPSDMEAFQEETGEVDPLSEADVYIAYGRYQQADELVRQAIDEYPERMDLKQKLLEVAFASKDTQTFTDIAEKLRQQGLEQKDPSGWQNMVTMGRELVPESALFAGSASIRPAADDTTSHQDTLSDAAQSATPLKGGDGLDFDLGLTTDIESPEAAEVALKKLDTTGSEPTDSLDLNADELTELEDALKIDSDENDGTDVNLTLDDFNNTLDLGVASGEEGSDEEVSGFGMDGDGLDDAISLDNLDLDGIDLGIGDVDLTEDGQPLSDFDVATSDSRGDNVDLDPSIGSTASADFSIDEVTTKLDLARAYVDMGDSEGARSILDEVLSEGNDSQKEEANELLEHLT